MNRVCLLVVTAMLVGLAGGAALGADIVTVPTANQLRAGEVDVAYYYINIDRDSLITPLQPLGIDSVRVQTLYVGVTDRVEIDAHRYDVDEVGKATIWNATVLVVEEDERLPSVVLGGRDLSRVYGKASYHISAAKTVNPPKEGPPTQPIVRLHVSLGTEDNTLLGEGRHKGLFGGVQTLLRPASPAVGLVALHDATDLIVGLTVVPEPGWPTLKAGTFGGHWWVGVSHTFNVQ